MRYVLLSLSAILCLGWMSCKNNDNQKTTREMSAVIKRNSADSGFTWNADAGLVQSEIPFARSVRFKGSQYQTNPTSVNIFVNNYRGEGTYKIYQGSAKQTDSNSAVVTYQGREFTSIAGTIEVIQDNGTTYIGRYSFTAKNLNDTMTIKSGSFNIDK